MDGQWICDENNANCRECACQGPTTSCSCPSKDHLRYCGGQNPPDRCIPPPLDPPIDYGACACGCNDAACFQVEDGSCANVPAISIYGLALSEDYTKLRFRCLSDGGCPGENAPVPAPVPIAFVALLEPSPSDPPGTETYRVNLATSLASPTENPEDELEFEIPWGMIHRPVMYFDIVKAVPQGEQVLTSCSGPGWGIETSDFLPLSSQDSEGNPALNWQSCKVSPITAHSQGYIEHIQTVHLMSADDMSGLPDSALGFTEEGSEQNPPNSDTPMESTIELSIGSDLNDENKFELHLTHDPTYEPTKPIMLLARANGSGTGAPILGGKFILTTVVDLAIPTEETPPLLASTNNNWAVPASGTAEVDLVVGAVLVPRGKKLTEGGWVVLNFDDDDGRGNYSDGNTAATPDLDFSGAITKENDMIRVGIKKVDVGSQQVSYRFRFSGPNIRLWKKSNRTEQVISEQTEMSIGTNMTYAAVHVEGIKPHDDDHGTKITGQIKIGDGQWIDAETVKVRVASPIVCVWGDLDEWHEDQAKLAAYLVAQTGDDQTRRRYIFSTRGTTLMDGYTFLLAGKNSSGNKICYSVTGIVGILGERAFKLALKTEGVDITATGHANYGVGLAFGKDFREYNQFFNMAGGGTTSLAPNAFGNHPEFSVPNASLANALFYKPGAIARLNNAAVANPTNRSLQGIPVPNVDRFPHLDQPQVPLNGAFTVRQGSNGPNPGKPYENLNPNPPHTGMLAGILTWHMLEDGLLTGGEAEEEPTVNTIIHCGNQDVPAQLRYRSLLINTCNSLRNFAESFKYGNVFAAWESVGTDIYTREYVKALVDGRDWTDVLQKLNEIAEPVHPSNTTIGHKLYEKLSY